MKRREFIELLSSAANGAPLAAGAQQNARMRRVGVLMSTSDADAYQRRNYAAFAQSFENLGLSGRHASEQVDVFAGMRADVSKRFQRKPNAGGVRRRQFIAILAGAAATWPMVARAQQSQMKRIGVLIIGNADALSFGKELREGLRELGRIEGQHYVVELRSAEGQLSRLPELAAELVRLKVDVIVALLTPCGLAAKQATREIPIVTLAGDPLGAGLVESLSRPGATVTGLSLMAAETLGKCVELFRDMLPSARRVAVIANGADPVFTKAFLEQAHLAGSITRTEISPVVMVRGPDELEAAFATVVKEKGDAVVLQGSLPTKRMVELAIAHRLPAAASLRAFAEIGGLMSYAADGPALFRRTATFVHKILLGEKPADIAVEQPTKFELVINLKTARTIGITIPPALLARADEVIE